MLMKEVDIGLIPSPLPPIIQVILVDHLDFMFMVMREVEIGLIPATLLNINMVEYTFSTKGSLKKLLQGVCEEEIFKTVIKDVSYIHIKIVLIILIQEFQHTLIQA